MARGKKKAPSVEPVEEEPQALEEEADDMEVDEAQPLQFNEPLNWRPGKALAVAELLRRLGALSAELATLDQEDADRETLIPTAQELAHAQLLAHKDKGVKAFTMVCIVEMFRLLAPNAPYKSGQLKEIFSVFASTIIPALANPSDPYNQQHNMVLTSLTNVKSIVLITDIPGADYLLLSLFTNCFDVLAGGGKNGTGEKLPKNLEYHMTHMMCTLVEETEVIPPPVVDIILAQFLRADPDALAAGSKKGEAPSTAVPEPPPAYNMARSVCNTCSEKLERAVGQYFHSVLQDVSESTSNARNGKPRGKKRTHGESEDESDDGLLTPPAEMDMREIEKAHRLLRELWRSCPDVVQNVVLEVEGEIQAESPWVRTLAVQTFGDMISGIGAAGPLPPAPMDPAAYPPQSLEEVPAQRQQNPLLVPNAPHAFSSVFPTAYHAFIDRHKDKAPAVRSAWAISTGRILLTSGGGKGLDEEQEKSLLVHFSSMLTDTDEKVRLSAVQAVAQFDFFSIVNKIGKAGTATTPNSVLFHLADRIKDRKHAVRCAATELLARIWGVAAGAITEGNERIRTLFGGIPSKILDAWYVNDREIHALVSQVLFDHLLPVTFPPIKPKASISDLQRVNDSQPGLDTLPDPDAIRAERILTLVRDLDERARKVFFGQQVKRSQHEAHFVKFLKMCEETYGNSDDGEKEGKKTLERYTEAMVKQFTSVADSALASEHLKKFAKHHDRRSYQLIRFCFSAESDYRKISKAMKELTKRMEEAPKDVPTVLETLIPIVRSTAMLVYNKSHVPAIVAFSRTDDKGLGTAAHEVLKEISMRAPDIFKTHVHELCETLKSQKPTTGVAMDEAVVDTLKACAGFARKFPADMPKDRDFYNAMVNYSIRGTPPKAAKHAVTVTISSADKKEMYIKDIQKACIQNFEYGEEGFLSKLASISQLRLLANHGCMDQAEAIDEIAIGQILGQVREPADPEERDWEDEVDDDLAAKLWALRILVNGLRGLDLTRAEDPTKALRDAAETVYRLLNTLIKDEGELSKSSSTPKTHKAHLRLAAAIQLLKLSCNRTFDPLFTSHDLNQLSKIAQDECAQVRAGFAKALKKYLGAGQLGNRFYPLIFLYAFEPEKTTRDPTITWLKSRAAMSARTGDGVVESAFPRFLSLLAHHQDFSTETEHLADFVEYIMFYLKNVATEANLPLIYQYAQKLKTVRDAIDAKKSTNLYVLSDVAEAVIRLYQEANGWSIQLRSGSIGLPSGLFAKLASHAVAQEIAERAFLPQELAEGLEDLVKSSMTTKKRRAEGVASSAGAQQAKRARSSTTTTGTGSVKRPAGAKKVPKPKGKTPRNKREDVVVSSSERRKSTRQSGAGAKNYAENEDSDDDGEMETWQKNQSQDAEANKENEVGSTPPTSDPTPVPGVAEVVMGARKGKKGREVTTRSPAVQKLSKDKAVSQSPAQQQVKAKVAARSTRATRGKKERDIMDVPSDSD